MLHPDNPDQTRSLREGLHFVDAGHTDLALIALRQAGSEENDFAHLARLHLAQRLRSTGQQEAGRAVATVMQPFLLRPTARRRSGWTLYTIRSRRRWR